MTIMRCGNKNRPKFTFLEKDYEKTVRITIVTRKQFTIYNKTNSRYLKGRTYYFKGSGNFNSNSDYQVLYNSCTSRLHNCNSNDSSRILLNH